MKIWVDGALRLEGDATVSVFDHGFTVGDGVFETLKVTADGPFAVERHLARLTRSARGLGLPAPEHDEIRHAITETLDANSPVDFARLRITYTGGVSPLGSERGDKGPTLVVALTPAVRPAESTATITVPWPRNERGALAGLKTTSYGENVIALSRARAAGATEAIFADTRGMLSEGTGSNIFVVLGGRIRTPSLAAGCLAGITRGLVLEWADDVEEADLPIDVLMDAEEAFLTSTMRDVQPIHRIDGRELPADGPVTAKARQVFAERSAGFRD